MRQLSYSKIPVNADGWRSRAGYVGEQVLPGSVALPLPSETSFWGETGRIPAGK